MLSPHSASSAIYRFYLDVSLRPSAMRLHCPATERPTLRGAQRRKPLLSNALRHFIPTGSRTASDRRRRLHERAATHFPEKAYYVDARGMVPAHSIRRELKAPARGRTSCILA